jgi:hypothetical protein
LRQYRGEDQRHDDQNGGGYQRAHQYFGLVHTASYAFARIIEGQGELADHQRQGDDKDGADKDAADEGGTFHDFGYEHSTNRTHNDSGENRREQPDMFAPGGWPRRTWRIVHNVGNRPDSGRRRNSLLSQEIPGGGLYHPNYNSYT